MGYKLFFWRTISISYCTECRYNILMICELLITLIVVVEVQGNLVAMVNWLRIFTSDRHQSVNTLPSSGSMFSAERKHLVLHMWFFLFIIVYFIY